MHVTLRTGLLPGGQGGGSWGGHEAEKRLLPDSHLGPVFRLGFLLLLSQLTPLLITYVQACFAFQMFSLLVFSTSSISSSLPWPWADPKSGLTMTLNLAYILILNSDWANPNS